MSELTITLKGRAADQLRKLVAEERYANPEEAVAEALDALESDRDAALDSWLRDVIAERVDKAEPSSALTAAQVRALLRA